MSYRDETYLHWFVFFQTDLTMGRFIFLHSSGNHPFDALGNVATMILAE